MAISFVAAGTGASSSGNLGLTFPSGALDTDLLIAFIETANDGAHTVPSGWNTLGTAVGVGTAASTTATKLWAYWAWKSALGTGTQTWSSTSAANHRAGQMIAFRGVDTTTPIYAIQTYVTNASAVTAVPCPSVTTTSNNDWVVAATSNGTDTNTSQFSSATNANLTGIAARANYNSLTGSGGGVVAVSGEKATAGASGTTTINLATASQYSAFSFALKAATTPPPPAGRAQRSAAAFW